MTFQDYLILFQTILPVILSFAVLGYHATMTRLPQNVHDTLIKIVQTAVQAVEQTDTLLPGSIKKQEALKLVSVLLNNAGLKGIDVDAIDAMIESAVFALNKNKETTDVTQKITTLKSK